MNAARTPILPHALPSHALRFCMAAASPADLDDRIVVASPQRACRLPDSPEFLVGLWWSRFTRPRRRRLQLENYVTVAVQPEEDFVFRVYRVLNGTLTCHSRPVHVLTVPLTETLPSPSVPPSQGYWEVTLPGTPCPIVAELTGTLFPESVVHVEGPEYVGVDYRGPTTPPGMYDVRLVRPNKHYGPPFFPIPPGDGDKAYLMAGRWTPEDSPYGIPTWFFRGRLVTRIEGYVPDRWEATIVHVAAPSFVTSSEMTDVTFQPLVAHYTRSGQLVQLYAAYTRMWGALLYRHDVLMVDPYGNAIPGYTDSLEPFSQLVGGLATRADDGPWVYRDLPSGFTAVSRVDDGPFPSDGGRLVFSWPESPTAYAYGIHIGGWLRDEHEFRSVVHLIGYSEETFELCGPHGRTRLAAISSEHRPFLPTTTAVVEQVEDAWYVVIS